MASKDEVKITFKVFNQEFQSAMTEMQKKTTQLNREFRLQKEQMRLTGTESDKLKAQIGWLGDRYSMAQEKVKETEQQLNKAKKTFGDNSEEARKLEGDLTNAQKQEQYFANELEIANKKLKENEQKLRENNNSALNFSKAMQKSGENMQSAGKKISGVGKSLTTKVTVPLAAVGGIAVKSSVDFESAFAGVEKTVDGTTEQMAGLKTGIRDMAKEMPTSATAIAGVAESAGQLGIQTDNILGFTKTVIDMGNSTNMSADTAATSMARFANITGMSQNKFDNLGSSIVELGNNLATTESEIMDMSLRLAGAGKQVGMSEAQVMGFSGALSSVGVSAEQGGSSFSKLMIDMQLATETGNKNLGKFAKVAGMSSKDFQQAFKEDAAGAIATFIVGLGKSEEHGTTAIKVLDDMGIKEVRLRDTLLRAAGASDTFSDAVQMSTDAWGDNTALADEANKRYETTESKLEILKNKFKDVAMNLGEALMPIVEKVIDVLGQWAEKLDSLSPAQMDTIAKIGMVAAAVGPILLIVGKLVGVLGSVMTVMGTVSGAIGVLQTGAAASTPAIGGLASVFGVLKGPVGIALAAVAAFAAAAILVYKNWDKISAWLKSTWQSISDFGKATWGGISDFFINTGNHIAEFFAGIWESISATITSVWGHISDFFIGIWDGITSTATAAWTGITTFLTTIWTGISNFFATIWDGIKMIFTGAFLAIKFVVETAMTIIITIIRVPLELIKWLFETIWGAIGDTVMGYLNTIKSAITTAWNAITSVTTTIWNAIKSVVMTVWDAIKSAVTTAVNAVKSVVTTVWNAIKSVTTTVWNAVSGVVLAVWERLKNGVTKAINAVKSVIDTVWNAIKTVTTTIWNAIVTVVTGVWEKIKTAVSTAINAVKEKITTIWNTIKSTTTTVWNSIKSAISKPIEAAKAAVSNAINAIKTFMSNTFDNIKSSATAKFNAIKEAMSKPIEAAKNAISNVIDTIKGFFNKLKLKFPDIKPPKLPHFKLKGEFSLRPPSVPKLSVDWYSKGAIFKRPTVLAGGIGVGDANNGRGSQAEAVAPITDLIDIIKDAIRPVPIAEAQPIQSTVINFNGNYTFRDRDDIDYMLNQAELRAKRRER